ASNNKFLENISIAREGLNFSSQISFSGKVYNITYTGFSTKGGEIGDIAISGIDLSRETFAQMDVGRLETAISQSDEIVMITDTKGIIQYVNPAFEKITGYSINEAIGKNASLLKSGKHDQLFYKNLWNTISSGNVWRGHFFNRKKDGSIYEEDSVISPVKNKNNEIVNYVAVKRDVSKEVELQKELIQAQKMEAIGRLAGGIAHDFNNILTAILGYSDLALSICKNDESLKDAIEQIKSAGKRASTMTKQLLTFTRKQILNFETMSMKEILLEMEEMLKRLIGEEVILSFSLSEEKLVAKCDRGQIEQVIMNLVLNARDALPKSNGKINVSINKHLQKAPYEFSGFNAKPGEYVQLTVQDNGCGMTDEVKQKIFDPFFTTKPKGKGTGLGLATVYGIVKQHNGFITFDSVLNQGTTFNIFIPAASDFQQDREKSNIRKSEEKAVGENFERKVVLVAEDDKIIQMLVASYLSKDGYKVLLASDGLEAKQILAHRGNEIKFALLDVVMPFLDGGRLAEYILKLYPEIKIILMSGYPDVLESQEENVKKLPVLQKPFSQADLKSFVDKYFFNSIEKM
ncbi:MAG TPA: PAS domain S-box protein, partial [Victivallales bacterium]|nr:PAS domain S-box protein [Victivallales bacterium]